jgi:uncharacterized protein YdeI (YjbR/CyaY-like superfamily)
MELYVKTREEWRKWLGLHHTRAEDVWLIYYKKQSGKPRIPYSDAVEEALCFGWIDGKIRRINDDYYIQRFTPRRHGSRWSKYNIERVEKMMREGRMQPSGLAAFKEVLENPDLIYDNRSDRDPEIPDDLKHELGRNKKAKDNFLKFSMSVRRIYIEWLKSSKKEETRIRRIRRIIDLSERNIRPGLSLPPSPPS